MNNLDLLNPSYIKYKLTGIYRSERRIGNNTLKVACNREFNKDIFNFVAEMSEMTFINLAQILGLNGVNFCVGLHQYHSNPGLELNGNYYPKESNIHPNTIGLTINAPIGSLDLNDLAIKIRHKAGHEASHAARNDRLGAYNILGDRFIDEGIAINFANRYSGELLIVGDYYNEPPESQQRLKKIALSQWFTPPFTEFGEWFNPLKRYGSEIPTQAGYGVGYEMVNNYMINHPEQSIFDLIGMPTEAFFEDFIKD